MRLPSKKTVTRLIVGIHLVFLCIILFSHPDRHQKKTKSIIVRTVAPAVAKKAEPVMVKSEPKKAPPAVKKPAPTPSATVVKKQTPKKAEATKKDPTPSAPVQKRQQISTSLLKELEESLAKIEDSGVSKRPTSSKAKMAAPSALHIDRRHEETESSYSELLTQLLHESLHLPDFGEVKMEVTVRQDGTVVKVVVLKTESEKNKKYLESNLIKIKMPPLAGKLVNEHEHTFILTFCNEL